MSGRDLTPGTWATLSPQEYRRLVGLARRRLVGCDGAAEDVVSLALIKWRLMGADTRGRARIEQVIRSEAASWRRSESRRRDRECRYATTVERPPTLEGLAELNLALDRELLRRTAHRHQITVDPLDTETLRRLLRGDSMTEIARDLAVARSTVRASRKRWQQVLGRSVAEER